MLGHRRRVRLRQERREHDDPRADAGRRTPRSPGEILFEGSDLLKMPADDLRSIRGNEISMIFQDPLSSLHPFFKVGRQLVEAIQVHQDVRRRGRRAPARSSCSGWSASPTPSAGSASTRTSSRAACASA